MKTTEKAPTSAATLTRAGEEDVLRACNPQEENNMTAPARQVGRIEALLRHGEKNAIATKDLVKLAEARTARDLQSDIEQERIAGALILSKGGHGGGYFLPAEGEAGRQEIAAFIRTLNARAVSTQRTLKAARRALASLDGQGQIEGVL